MNMPGQGGPQGYPGFPPHGSPPQGPPPQGPPAQHQGPPPGYQGYQGAPTQQFGPGGPPPQRPPMPRVFAAIWTLALVSVLATVLGLSLDEKGRNAWGSVHAWGGLAILGAVLTITPAVGHSFNLSRERAWQVAACGAGALVLFWVLFVLPTAGSNTSLLTTIGAAAGVIAVWIAPGREAVTGQGDASRPQGHSW